MANASASRGITLWHDGPWDEQLLHRKDDCALQEAKPQR